MSARRRQWLVLLVVCASGAAAAHARTVCNVRTYGATGNGRTKDTAAIQKAIDACAQRGGGIVLLQAGTYLSAPIVLKSGITLELKKGATLLGSPDHEDYPEITEFRAPGRQALVSATRADHVAIVGRGVIDGAGESWWQMARRFKGAGVLGTEHTRPRLVVFDHCTHVLVEGVTIQNSPMWQLVPYYSSDVTNRNVTVLAPAHSPNTDAIDPFSSSHVRVEHVLADVGDDDIAIKSGAIGSPGPDAPSRDILIKDCTFRHGHGLSIGSEIAGGAEGIRVAHINFEGTENGIRIKANRDRGHEVSDVVFRHIVMKGVKHPLVVSEYYPKMLPQHDGTAAPVTRLTPHFHDITIEDLTATGAEDAGVIAGLPEAPIRNLTLHNVRIAAGTGLTVGYAAVRLEHVRLSVKQGPAIRKISEAKIAMQQ
ncbi:MAG TPA: glycoside hydrolase family 28 protein [Terracidiphilus sp.]|nr:glycoside hydrolase family 28 protein [Terracidiphilus sp.]